MSVYTGPHLHSMADQKQANKACWGNARRKRSEEHQQHVAKGAKFDPTCVWCLLLSPWVPQEELES